MPASSTLTPYSPDKLIAGETILHHEKITLVTPENRARASLLGKISIGAAVAAAIAGNTGNGVFGAVTTGADAKVGVYKVIFIEPGANVGTFIVEDPDGIILGKGVVAVAFAGAINFTIADGAADFVAGDGFTVTVAEGSGKYKLSAAAATDGSQRPLAILAEDADATAADVEALVYTTGDFNEDALVLGVGHTVASVREALRARGIFLISVQGA